MHCGRRDAKCSHLVRLQPDPHGEGAVAENVGALDAADSTQLWLDYPREIVGNLILIQIGRREAEIHGCKLIVRSLQVNDRRFGFRRQIIAYLRHLCLDLRERGIGIIVKLQVHGNCAEPLSTRRFHVVNAVCAGDHALQRRGDESAHQVRIGSHIHGRNLHNRNVAPRVLPHAQGTDCLKARNQNHQIHDDCENRPLDEQIGELHLIVLRLWGWIVARLDLVVNSHCHTVAKLENAGGHYLIARIDARDYGNLVSSGAFHLYELLPDAAIGCAVRTFDIGDDENGIAEWRVADGRRGQRNHRALVTHSNVYLDEHPGAQLAARVSQSRLDLHVAGRLINDGINRAYASGKLASRQAVTRQANVMPDLHLSDNLLRHAEVDIDWIQRLKRNDGGTGREILPKIHLSNPQNTRKWRANRFPRDRCANLINIGFGLTLVRRRLVIVHLRDDALIYQ